MTGVYKSEWNERNALAVVPGFAGGGAGFRTTGGAHVHLTPADVRRLINGLEPHAAPVPPEPKPTATEAFKALPIGAKFYPTRMFVARDAGPRVKVSAEHYAQTRTFGDPILHEAAKVLADYSGIEVVE